MRRSSVWDRVVTPVLFLHGFTGVPETFEPIARSLQSTASVIAPALLGHATGPEHGESFGSEVERLVNVLTQQASTPAVVVGYSLGARLALGVAALRPSAVRSLILIGVNPGLRSEQDRLARVADDEQLARFLEQHGTAAFLEQRWENQPLFASQRSLPASVLADQAAQRRRHSATGLAHCLRVLGLGAMPSQWDTLPTLATRVPITLLTGTLDGKFHALAEEICSLSRKIAWLSVPDVGHNLLLEAPELVSRIVQHALH
jgi:2-succinyl-6-hydroxy-2,4-cyclohexadiene-1-carboxylate synthase